MRATGPAASSSLALLDCPHRANLQTGAGFGSQPSGTAVSENQGVESRSAIGASDFLEGEERDQRNAHDDRDRRNARERSAAEVGPALGETFAANEADANFLDDIGNDQQHAERQ